MIFAIGAEGRMMIHPSQHDGRPVFMISSREVWMPGIYDSEQTARYAFQFPNETLQRLQDSVNPGGVITVEMLKRERRNFLRRLRREEG